MESPVDIQGASVIFRIRVKGVVESAGDGVPKVLNKYRDGASMSTAMFGFTVGQEVTATRRLWEPPDGDSPGGLLAVPGDRLIVRSFGGSQQHPISVSHQDRTDGMTFFVSPDELKPITLRSRAKILNTRSNNYANM